MFFYSKRTKQYEYEENSSAMTINYFIPTLPVPTRLSELLERRSGTTGGEERPTTFLLGEGIVFLLYSIYRTVQIEEKQILKRFRRFHKSVTSPAAAISFSLSSHQ